VTTSNARSYTAAPGRPIGRTDVRPVSRAEIALAINRSPVPARRARQRQYLEALARDAELAGLRADRQRNIREIARILARYASWRDSTTRPTRARLCELARVSVSTWKAARRWLEAHGYLGLVRGGRTPWLRAGVLVDDGAENEAAIFVLAIPRSKTAPGPAGASLPARTRPLSPSDRTVVKVRARTESQDQEEDSARAETHFRRRVAGVERISAGQGISEGWVSHLVGPFLAAGWAWRDLSYTLDHEPAGTPYRLSLKAVRAPRAWLAWRLSQWIGPDGQPMASPTELRASGAAAIAAEQQARRAAAAELAAGRVDPGPHAAAIRDRLGWRPRSRGEPGR
jgi:hypothetical protein